MAVVSKELFEKVCERNGEYLLCSEIHSWEKSCWKACISPYLINKIGKGSGTFFLTVYLIKFLLNYKRIKDKKFLYLLLLSEIRSICYGLAMGTLLISAICIVRYLTGRINYYGIVFVPGFVSGLSLLVESEENRKLDTLIFFNSFVETILIKARLAKKLESFIFIGISGLLMTLLENRNGSLNSLYFWFYTPSNRIKNPTNDNECQHPSTCTNFVTRGFSRYFAIGYIIGNVRFLLPRLKMLMKSPRILKDSILNKKNIKFGMFLGSYVGIYRAVMCLLTNTDFLDKKFRSLIAGFSSGLTYTVFPNMQILIIGITTLLQLLYLRITIFMGIKHKSWYRQLLFMFTHGYLLHNMFYMPDTVSPYYKNMIDICCTHLIEEIRDRIVGPYIS